MRLVLIGNPGLRRTALLATAARKWSDLELKVISWIDLIHGSADLRRIVFPDDHVRLDSPGKDFEVERALLRAGLACPGNPIASRREIDALVEDRGRILWPALWYRGFCNA